MNVIRQGHLAGERVLGVVVALDIKRSDPAFAQALQLERQEGGCPRATLRPVEQIACNQQGGYFLGKRGVDDPG